MEEIDIIISHGLIITMKDEDDILYDGAVAVKGNTIVGIGSSKEILKRYSAKRIISAEGKAVLPGFFNTHHHILQNLLKGDYEDLSFPEWIDNVSAPRITMVNEDYLANNYLIHYHAHRLAVTESLLGGITTLVNMEWAPHPAVLDVIERGGIRCVTAPTFTDIDRWNNPGMLLPLDRNVDLADKLIDRCRYSDGRLMFRYGLACPNSCSAELIQEIKMRAGERNVGITMHMAESEPEKAAMQEKFGTSTIGYLNSLGLLGPEVLGVHCIYVNDEDIKIIRDTGMSVSYCPESHMKLGLGTAPIIEMLNYDIPVSLGTDGAVNDNMDMLEAARCAVFIQRIYHKEPGVISAYQALEMITKEGARSLGLEKTLGTLETGKLADIVLLDISGIHIRPINHIINNLVYAAFAEKDVDTVLCDGKIVVENGKPVALDPARVINEGEAYLIPRLKERGLNISPWYSRSDH